MQRGPPRARAAWSSWYRCSAMAAKSMFGSRRPVSTMVICFASAADERKKDLDLLVRQLRDLLREQIGSHREIFVH